MTTIEINRDYFNWLCGRVDCSEHGRYEDVLMLLYSRLFYSLVPHDDNRGLDGLDLRLQYQNDTNIVMTRHEMEKPCNLLEMLIALAERMSFNIFDPQDDGSNIAFCFWEMITNLNLKPKKRYQNSVIIDKFLARDYDYYGHGNIFPLRNPRTDQKVVEIWYQMMGYINENF